MEKIINEYHDATEYHRTDWQKKILISNKVGYQINNIIFSQKLFYCSFVTNYIQSLFWNLFLRILFYKQSRNRHFLKPVTKQILNLPPFLEVVCSTAVQNLSVYFRNLTVIIHEMMIKGLFLLSQKKVNQNRRYLLSYFPLYGLNSNATGKHDFINV